MRRTCAATSSCLASWADAHESSSRDVVDVTRSGVVAVDGGGETEGGWQ